MNSFNKKKTTEGISYEEYFKWSKLRNKLLIILIIIGLFYVVMTISIYFIKNILDNGINSSNIVETYLYKLGIIDIIKDTLNK